VAATSDSEAGDDHNTTISQTELKPARSTNIEVQDHADEAVASETYLRETPLIIRRLSPLTNK
jgi:hypothetical protein